MQVTVEDVSSVKKTLHIEIPEDEVARELNNTYNTLKKTAKIKGFRPGKVPRSVLERMFGKNVHADVSSKLIQNSFLDAIKQANLKVVGTPQVDPPELDPKGPYKYDATVEITPEIEDIYYQDLKLKRTNYQMSDDEVDAQLKALQKNLAQHQKISQERPVRQDDIVLIDYEGFKDGKPFAETGKTENYTLKIGAGAISKDFDNQLIGMKPGDTKEINATFPEDFFNKALANNEITFQVTLNEIRQELLPEIDDEFAKKVGQYETLDELKNVLEDNLKQGYAKRVEQELNEQIFSALISKTDFEAPDALVDMELEGIIEEAERSFAHRNTSMKELGLSREEIAEKYRDTALKQVKRYLILSKLIDQENLTLSDEEVENGLKEMSENFGHSLADIKNYYGEHKDKLELFKHTLLEKKAINLIIDNSKIEEVEPEALKASEKNDQKK
ncbi:MAG: trigger factor [Desulfobacterales bacterium]|nr:MAG: trigger factor [Desulfobacterales bacterium]